MGRFFTVFFLLFGSIFHSVWCTRALFLFICVESSLVWSDVKIGRVFHSRTIRVQKVFQSWDFYTTSTGLRQFCDTSNPPAKAAFRCSICTVILYGSLIKIDIKDINRSGHNGTMTDRVLVAYLCVLNLQFFYTSLPSLLLFVDWIATHTLPWPRRLHFNSKSLNIYIFGNLATTSLEQPIQSEYQLLQFPLNKW